MNTVFVTGGSTGIGLSICTMYLQMGWRVVSLSRTPPPLDDCIHIETDFAQCSIKEDRIREILNECKDKICLVHNAAQHVSDTALKADIDYLSDLFNISIKGAAKLNSIFSNFLNEGSSIIYIGSTLSELGVPGNFSYITIKHAVVGMMRATQQDMSERKVHTCCICPGVTATRMATESEKFTDDFFSKRVSLGRYVEPEEIATLTYFCSENPTLNGSVIHANLGQINS
ncbi:SDR family NAD(P)-dependent oxidoreductase [Photorhabdus bodei]|uniref:Short-chain dehydrogenase n=1 Tax=Photorhabdus bodei TaxID=2029681 RepID=A0A329X9S6_9GAMM|nr:SDR family oxidoreductase [Photorhabdus bodei]RAX13587.1 short-chain dehydrogenase [Photorhabdus bodei]